MTADPCALPPAGVLAAFGAITRDFRVARLGNGNINDTYLVEGGGRRFVLQRINPVVFAEPRAVIVNFARISDHLHAAAAALGLPFLCARPIATSSGAHAYVDARGAWWRAQSWLDHLPADRLRLNRQTARQLGQVLARFHLLTADLDSTALTPPIPQFHHTPYYLDQFDRAAAAYQGPGSVELARALAAVERLREVAWLPLDDAEGERGCRLIHGDPKLDNVIFSQMAEAVGLFDLDTAGPGLILSDIGDCLRSATNVVGAREENWQGVRFDLDHCRAVLGGYLDDGQAPIDERERSRIFDAVLVLSVELGLRFLADYLCGNLYFKAATAKTNLHRALGQLRLAELILAKEREIRALTRR
ncbi:MAG: phosphotransferase enzyme family protein [Desulfopila sp.]